MDTMIGHNQPDEIRDLAARTGVLVAAANKWLALKEIADERQASLAEDFDAQLREAIKAIDTHRKEVNAPLQKQVKVTNERCKAISGLLEKARALLRPLRTAWLQKVQERLTAERQKAEAEALAATERAQRAAHDYERAGGDVVAGAVAVDTAKEQADAALDTMNKACAAKPGAKGLYGARSSSLRTHWHGEITDQEAVYRRYRKNPDIALALHRLVMADIRRGTHEIEGVKITSSQTAA